MSECPGCTGLTSWVQDCKKTIQSILDAQIPHKTIQGSRIKYQTALVSQAGCIAATTSSLQYQSILDAQIPHKTIQGSRIKYQTALVSQAGCIAATTSSLQYQSVLSRETCIRRYTLTSKDITPLRHYEPNTRTHIFSQHV
jgi:S-adenosylmethionine:tRNA-ribosyltransferase-isomerase (queuine synthetase)